MLILGITFITIPMIAIIGIVIYACLEVPEVAISGIIVMILIYMLLYGCHILEGCLK